MKKLAFVTALVMLSATGALAATKTYQVTGPVTALDDKSITVQKGKESWEIARDSDTKLPDTVKVNSKVTVYYTMTAGKVEDKSPAPKADAKSAMDTKATAAKTDKKPK